MAKIQSIKDQLGMKYQYTNRQKILNENRYWFVHNYFNQIIAKIVSYCIENDITDVFIGKNIGWKTETNMGKKNNQKFLAIPHAKLIDKLISKCEEHGITCHAQEESHTSKCSFLDRELVCHQEEYKGKRVKRGLFKTSQKVLLNADSNGGANILIKGLNSLKVSTEIITKVYD